MHLFVDCLQALSHYYFVNLSSPAAHVSNTGMMGLLFLRSRGQGKFRSVFLGQRHGKAFISSFLIKVSFCLKKLLCNTLMLPQINNSTELLFNLLPKLHGLHTLQAVWSSEGL